MSAHTIAERRVRPARPALHAEWGRLEPVHGRLWVDLLSPDAPDGLCILYALLDSGLVEAWQDRHGHVRLRTPQADG